MTTVYSLWAALEPQAERAIADVIRSSAHELQTPTFLPHMTVLGGISGFEEEEAVARTKQLAETMSELAVDICAVTSKGLYFQCVFLLLQLSDELGDAHRNAKRIFFGCEDGADFMPHIRRVHVADLVYGDLSAETKRELVAELGPRFAGSAVKLDRLQLWSTTGPVANWTLVRSFALR